MLWYGGCGTARRGTRASGPAGLARKIWNSTARNGFSAWPHPRRLAPC